MIGTKRLLGAAVAVTVLLLAAACEGDAKSMMGASSGKLVTTPVVLLKTYDAASGALQYQATTKVQEPDEAILASGPMHAATVAKSAKVLSAVNICSGDVATVEEKTGVGTKHCTLAQLDAALKHGAQVDAYLTMRGTTVEKVAEVYHP